MKELFDRLATALADRFRIECELGEGGMATVYLAEDLKHRRKVALKVLKPEVGVLIGAERFRREIEIAAKLNHPHILTLIDSGEVEGLLFYVLPQVEGVSLREKIDRHKQLPIPEAIRLTSQLASALSYAHRSGVVHRDIKPENVLIHEGVAMLTDFGIALAASDTRNERLTETGVSLGTPYYMSPEQAAGDSQVDHRADIYALGVLAYEMLAGHPPFNGDSAQMVMSQHVTKTPEPVDTVRDGVPPEFAQLVMRCMEKKPTDRWQTTSELVQVLDTVSGSSSTEVRSRAWNTNRMITVVLLVITAIATFVVGREFLLGGRSVENADRVAVAVFENKTGDPSYDLTGERIGDWITDGLHLSGTVDVVPWSTARSAWQFVQLDIAQGRVSDPLGAFGKEVDAGIVVSGTIYLDNDTLRFQPSILDITTGEIVAPITAIEESVAALTDGINQVRQRVMGALAVTADDRIVVANPPTHDAFRVFTEGLELYRREAPGRAARLLQAFELDTTYLVPLIYAGLAAGGNWALRDSITSVLQGRRSELSDYYRFWVDYLDARVSSQPERALQAMRDAAQLAPHSKAQYNRAFMAIITNRPHEALEALSELDPLHGAMRADHNYWLRMNEAYFLMGEYEEMLRVVREGLTLHPDWFELLGAELRALAYLGRVDEMYEILQRTSRATVSQNLAGVDVPRAESAIILRMEHPELAVPYQDAVLAWLENPSTPQPPNSTWYLRLLAISGRTEDALALARQRYETLGGFGTVAIYGVMLAHAGRDVEARQMADSLARGDWGPYGTDAPLRWRAEIAAQLGELDEAVRLLRMAFDRGHSRIFVRLDYFLYQPLRDHQEFHALMRPRDN